MKVSGFGSLLRICTCLSWRSAREKPPVNARFARNYPVTKQRLCGRGMLRISERVRCGWGLHIPVSTTSPCCLRDEKLVTRRRI